MVKRYGLETCMMLEDDCGQFVDFEDYEKLESERDALKIKLAKWEDEISKEMPLDFKDWWKNNKEEWPLVARLVLEMRRENIERLESELAAIRKAHRDDYREDIKRLITAAENVIKKTECRAVLSEADLAWIKREVRRALEATNG